MSGLIDTDTGLAFGEGLQFQTQIGTAGLTIETESPEMELLWGSDFLVWDTLNLTWGLE